jgi:uncharacterized membrane protein YhaH (DUF805 family)
MNFLKGRANRAIYWLSIGLVVVLYAGISMLSRKQVGVSEGVLLAVAVPRLHDIGRTGWLTLVPIGIEVVGLIAAFSMLPLETAKIAMGVVTLVIAALMIWLGAIPGQPSLNSFGEPPVPGLGAWRKRNPS